FAMSLLCALVVAKLGVTIHGLPKVPSGPGALAMGAFVLLWLAFWTLGGIAAATTVLTMWWGLDRIEVDGSGVRRLSRIGPFRARRFVAREEVRAVNVRRAGVSLETPRGPVSLTCYGTRDDHEAIRDEIQRALN